MPFDTPALERRCDEFAELSNREAILEAAIRLLTSNCALHMSWVAEPDAGGVRVTQVSGNRTNVSRGTLLRLGRGLGGKVWEVGRSVYFDDYLSDGSITHDYDSIVTPEDLHAMAATPLRYGSRTYGVLLGGYRGDYGCGLRALRPIETVAERAAEALYFTERLDAAVAETMRLERRRAAAGLRDELDLLLGALLRDLHDARAGTPAGAIGRHLRALERRTHAGLLNVRRSLDNFAGLQATDPSMRTANSRAPRISEREVELLRHAAVGATNAEIAAAMHLSAHTVKGYLRKVMAKLGARNRVEAVVVARDFGIL